MEENKQKNEIEIQQAMIELLLDSNAEHKKIQKRQTGIIVLLIVLLFATFCSFLIYLNQYDFATTETVTTTTKNDANAYDKNNKIEAKISDIKVNSNDKK